MTCSMTINTTMGTEGVYSYGEIQNTKPSKVAHKVHLVSPRMDVDVTGVAFKRMRTQIIDHPRDEGLRQREQLWNYQQRYRGAVGKLKSITINGANNTDEQLADETDDGKEEDNGKHARSPVDKTSLQTRFRRRLSSKMKLASLRQSDLYLEAAVKSQVQPEKKEEEKVSQPGIQRLYSSGLIVKNSLYKQLRQGEGADDRRNNNNSNNQNTDNSRILEAIEKFGSLEKLPDISFPNSETAVHHSLRTLKSLSSYSRRFLEQTTQERRITPLQRAQTITDASRPAMKKIFILDKKHNHTERVLKMECVDSAHYDDDDDEDDDDDDDDENDLDVDYEDECHNESSINCAAKHHGRGCDINHQDHVAIRSNVTTVNTQDDLALIQSKQMQSIEGKNGLRHEKTFHVQSNINGIIPRTNNGIPSDMTRIYKDFVSSATVSNHKRSANTNANNTNKENPTKNTTTLTRNEQNKQREDKVGSKEREDKTARKSRVKCSSRKDKSSAVQDEKEKAKEVEYESDESIDIPKERVGPTTHSIERKLSIRKPWEWKPSPFRWIDKPYVRESDKPYIERVLNRGEIIDEFNYDSFARTKPLKVQNYPENAGYKDRQGNLR